MARLPFWLQVERSRLAALGDRCSDFAVHPALFDAQFLEEEKASEYEVMRPAVHHVSNGTIPCSCSRCWSFAQDALST